MTAFNPYLQRLDEEIESAAPTKLISVLYRTLCERIGSARQALQAGQIRERAALISQAIAIVGELSQSLKPEADAQLAERLRQLYSYLIERLLEANAQQVAQPLDDALAVARVLHEGWSGIDATNAAFTGYEHAEPTERHLSYCG